MLTRCTEGVQVQHSHVRNVLYGTLDKYLSAHLFSQVGKDVVSIKLWITSWVGKVIFSAREVMMDRFRVMWKKFRDT